MDFEATRPGSAFVVARPTASQRVGWVPWISLGQPTFAAASRDATNRPLEENRRNAVSNPNYRLILPPSDTPNQDLFWGNELFPSPGAYIGDSLHVGLEAGQTIAAFGLMAGGATPFFGQVLAVGTFLDRKQLPEIRVLAGFGLVLSVAGPASRAALGLRGVMGETSSGVGLLAAPGSRVNVRGVQTIEMSGRLAPAEMAAMQRKLGVEVAQIYVVGSGKNGGGGTYHLIIGSDGNVMVPIGANVRLINHTHPAVLNGEVVPLRASGADKYVMLRLELAGSPQRTSAIVLENGAVIPFKQ